MAQGDALAANRDWLGAQKNYTRALTRFRQLNAPAEPALLALWSALYQNPAPIARLRTEAGIRALVAASDSRRILSAGAAKMIDVGTQKR